MKSTLLAFTTTPKLSKGTLKDFVNTYYVLISLLSVLSIKDLPDRERTHFIWGLSKDFGLAQFRFGAMYSWNEKLIKAMDSMCLYTCVQGHIQDLTRKMLLDKNWLNEIPTHSCSQCYACKSPPAAATAASSIPPLHEREILNRPERGADPRGA